MNKKFFVFHKSDIVRKGLAEILKTYFNAEIISSATHNELPVFYQISDCLMLIFSDNDNIVMLKPKISELSKHNQVILIKLCNNDNEANDENSLSINQNTTTIYNFVSDIIKNAEQIIKDNENSDLSKREKDVLRLVALGNSNKEIAEKLFISIHTVVTHRKNITEKLGIKSISGLTIYAVINKIIDTENLNIENLI